MDIARYLIENGSNVNTKSIGGPPPLIWACSSGDKGLVELLLYKKADVNICDEKGRTPLMCTRKNDNDILPFLLYKGADINQADYDEWTPLMWACFHGNIEPARLLINKGAFVDLESAFGWTPLMGACKGQHVDVVSLLLENKANVHKDDKYGRTPLLLVCKGLINPINFTADYNIYNIDHTMKTLHILKFNSKDFQIVSFLLDHGSDIERLDIDYMSPLMYACEAGNYQIAELLITKGAIIGRKFPDGKSILLKTCELKHLELARFLSKNGADVIHELIYVIQTNDAETFRYLVDITDNINDVNSDGKTPLIVACSENFRFVHMLLEKGAKANKCDAYGLTPLHLSCILSFIETVVLLLEHGADINMTADMKSTFSLFKRYLFFHPVVMNMLTKINTSTERSFLTTHVIDSSSVVMSIQQEEYFLSISKNDFTDLTPLMVACMCGNHLLAAVLIDHKANINLSNTSGMSALMLTCKYNELAEKISTLLIENGAKIDAVDTDGRSALYWTCCKGDITSTNLLLRYGANTESLLFVAYNCLIFSYINEQDMTYYRDVLITAIKSYATVDNIFNEFELEVLCLCGYDTIIAAIDEKSLISRNYKFQLSENKNTEIGRSICLWWQSRESD